MRPPKPLPSTWSTRPHLHRCPRHAHCIHCARGKLRKILGLESEKRDEFSYREDGY